MEKVNIVRVESAAEYHARLQANARDAAALSLMPLDAYTLYDAITHFDSIADLFYLKRICGEDFVKDVTKQLPQGRKIH